LTIPAIALCAWATVEVTKRNPKARTAAAANLPSLKLI
jgi:hypothetical protein